MKTILAWLCWLPFTFISSGADWTFDTPTNDAAAVIAPGPFGVGWLPEALGATGVVDLGRQGIAAFVAEANPPSDTFTLSTVEWWDGGIYSEFCPIESEGQLLSESVELVQAGQTFGAWKRHTTVWKLPLATNQFFATLTSPWNGGLLDSVSITPSNNPPTVVQVWVEVAESVGGPWRVVAGQSLTNTSSQAIYRLRIEK